MTHAFHLNVESVTVLQNFPVHPRIALVEKLSPRNCIVQKIYLQHQKPITAGEKRTSDMSDSSPSFGSTIASGIQDITAILPLLGTEQCERHTETGLSKGFMYTAATPISIFGSLGIVKAGASILMLAIPPGRHFWGAKFLADSGFELGGAVSPMMACNPEISTKFLAESAFEKLLETEHVEDVESLQIDWADYSWNIRMAFSTFTISSLGFIPYIYIILRSESPHQSALLPLFPAARILGCMLTCILVQIIIQIRILVIIKSRLIFMRTDHYIHHQMSAIDRNTLTTSIPLWHTNQASELCLQKLQYFLETRSRDKSTSSGLFEWAAGFKPFSGFKGPPTFPRVPARQRTRSDALYANIEESVEPDAWSFLQQHLSETHKIYLPQSKIWITTRVFILPLLLGFALLLSIAGYIGTFNFVQKSDNEGPISWLLLEGFLCLVRIAVWRSNPKWDDNPGMKLSFVKTARSPLLTTTLSINDLVQSDISQVHLIHSKDFLGEIAFHSWPLPTFPWDDMSLYYFLAVSQPSKSDLHDDVYKVLCILLCDYDGQTSRIIFRNHGEAQFSYLIPADCQHHGTRGTSLNTLDLRNASPTTANTNAFLCNPHFLEQLTKHYAAIITRMNKANESDVTLLASWVLQAAKHEPGTDTRQPDSVKLTIADKSYLDNSSFQATRDLHAIWLATWIQEYLKAYTKKHLREMPTGISESIKLAESLEVLYLVTMVGTVLERELLFMYTNWKAIGDKEHAKMMLDVMVFFDSGESRSLERIKYTNKFKMRLAEGKVRAAHARKIDFDNMKERMRKEMDDLVQAAKPDTTNVIRYSTITDSWTQNLGLNDDWGAYIQNDTTSTSTNIAIPRSSHIDAVATCVLDMEQRLSDKAEVLGRCRLRANEWQKYFESVITPYLSLYNPVHRYDGRYTWRAEPEDGHEISSTIAKAHAHGMDRRKHISLVVSNSLIECLSNLESIIALVEWFDIPVLYFDFNTPVAPTEDLSKDDDLREFRADNQDIKLSDLDLASIYHILKHCSCVTDIFFLDNSYNIPELLMKTIEQHVYNILRNGPRFKYIVQFEDVDFSNHQGSLF